MTFKSRKDTFTLILLYSVIVLLIFISISIVITNGIDIPSSLVLLLNVGLCGLFLWILYGTRYELDETHLKYKSGPLKGKIPINSIRELHVGKTMWIGIKPATARKGIIIKYNSYDEIYISPESNEQFVKEIRKLNDQIKIL